MNELGSDISANRGSQNQIGRMGRRHFPPYPYHLIGLVVWNTAESPTSCEPCEWIPKLPPPPTSGTPPSHLDVPKLPDVFHFGAQSGLFRTKIAS